MVILPHINALACSFDQSLHLHRHAEPFLSLAYTFLMSLSIHSIEVNFPQLPPLLATIFCSLYWQFRKSNP